MRAVEPEVFLVSRPDLDYDAIAAYLAEVGGQSWLERFDKDDLNDAQNLAELAGRLCFDDETEILTDEGWKNGLKLEGHERVLTWNAREQRAEFQDYIPVQWDYDGELVTFEQRNLDLAVTPDHRLFVQKMHEGGLFGDWHIATAATVAMAGHWRMKRDSTPVTGAEPPDVISEPPCEYRSGADYRMVHSTKGFEIPTGLYLRLLGYAIAEGFTSRPKAAGHSLTLTQAQGPVLERMIALVAEIGLPSSAYPDPRKPHVVNLVIHTGKQLAARLAADMGGATARSKRIPRWVLELDARWLELVYEAMWEGDGSLVRTGRRSYDTSSEGLADDVQELLIRLGKPASVRTYRLATGLPMFRVRELQEGEVITRAAQRGMRPYLGRVWCVSTRNGIVMVRRNKVAVWSGNCYRSWEPGLNPNVTKVRTDQTDYLQNILKSLHGSVLEHVNFGFVLHNVSRVLTHEIIRHRPGVAISQESLRFVRLDEIPFWFPEWARADDELMKKATELLEQMEAFQLWMADHFHLDEEGVPFHDKKHKTSFMRRLAPDGVATGLVWTANVRTLRHTIEARTAPGAEEEIRLLFGKIGEIMQRECPALFADYVVEDGAWVPGWRKV